MGLSYTAAHVFLRPARQPVGSTPTAWGLSYEDVTLTTADGLRLSAWYVPTRNRAAIILLHGKDNTRVDMMAQAAVLARGGYGVLVYDQRGHGNSQGDWTSLGYWESRDVSAAIAHLQSRPELDGHRLGLMGCSMGGGTAILAAAQEQAIAATISESAFSSVDYMVASQFNTFVRLPPVLAPLVTFFGERLLGLDAARVQPVGAIGRISPRPVLLIHGAQDSVIYVQNSLDLFAAAGEPRELWVVPGAGHCGAMTAAPRDWEDRVLGFFDRWLGVARGPESQGSR